MSCVARRSTELNAKRKQLPRRVTSRRRPATTLLSMSKGWQQLRVRRAKSAAASPPGRRRPEPKRAPASAARTEPRGRAKRRCRRRPLSCAVCVASRWLPAMKRTSPRVGVAVSAASRQTTVFLLRLDRAGLE